MVTVFNTDLTSKTYLNKGLLPAQEYKKVISASLKDKYKIYAIKDKAANRIFYYRKGERIGSNRIMNRSYIQYLFS